MSSFIERIEERTRDLRRHVRAGEILVNYTDLMELTHHYRQLDSKARVEHNRGRGDLREHLHETAEALFYECNGDMTAITQVIFGTLLPMIEKEQQRRAVTIHMKSREQL